MSTALAARRAKTGATGDAGAPMAWRTRASHPAARGAEADVSSNTAGKPPTPLTGTRSGVTHAGLVKVRVAGPATPSQGSSGALTVPGGHWVVVRSSTGPWELKGSSALLNTAPLAAASPEVNLRCSHPVPVAAFPPHGDVSSSPVVTTRCPSRWCGQESILMPFGPLGRGGAEVAHITIRSDTRVPVADVAGWYGPA